MAKEIPAHWEVKRFEAFGEIQAGAGPGRRTRGQTQEYPFFKVGDMGMDANNHSMVESQHTVSTGTAS